MSLEPPAGAGTIMRTGRDPRHGRQRGSTGGEMQRLSTGKFHHVPLFPTTGERHPIDRVRRPSAKLISECSPADSTNAAVNWLDYGRSRWQISDKITTIAGVHVRGRSSYFAAREAGSGPLQMPWPATVASGYRGAAGTTLKVRPGSGRSIRLVLIRISGVTVFRFLSKALQ
jgi:hypothetical protein